MKLKHAQMILSGELYVYSGEGEVTTLYCDEVEDGGKTVNSIPYDIELSYEDRCFCLRQLALKVVGEKEKGK